MSVNVPDLGQVRELPRQGSTVTVSADHLDANGHMNVRWYFDLSAAGLSAAFDEMGIGLEASLRNGSGLFTLGQHLSYLSESLVADVISAHVALVDRSAKAVHGITYLLNETRGVVTHSNEFLGLYVDLGTRKAVPFPAAACDVMDRMLAATAALSWIPKPCGALGVRHGDRQTVEVSG